MERMKRCPYCAEDVLIAAIKCKHCGSNLDGSGPPSPTERPRPVARPIFRFFGILAVFLVLLAIIYRPRTVANDPPEASASTLSEAPLPVPVVSEVRQPPSQTALRFTAEELAQEYEANEVATDLRIGKAPVYISGIVHSITKDFTDDARVDLQTSVAVSNVGIALLDSQKPLAAALSKGELVEFECTSVRLFMNRPMADGCKIIDMPQERPNASTNANESSSQGQKILDDPGGEEVRATAAVR